MILNLLFSHVGSYSRGVYISVMVEAGFIILSGFMLVEVILSNDFN